MAAPAAVLSILVRANTGQAVSGLARVNTQLGATQASSNKALGAIKTLAKGAAIGAAGGIGYAVKKAADFEQQLDSLGSVSGATGRQMERFRKQAMKAGADTKFSALEAAEAQTELAKGGLSVAQISKGGLRSALALAAAGEMELADAAETTANALKLFGLEGKDTMKVADALATAANATTADVSDFAMALKQGGGVAKMAGLSFTETVLALEALAETGVRNSDAGTSMKTAFIQLLKPSEKQAALAKELGLNFVSASGGMKSMSSISEMLRAKLGGMTKAQRTAALATIAGTDGVRTLNALYAAGPAKLDKMKAGLDKTGTAAQVAAKKQDNLKGKLENLQGSVETAAIAIGVKWLPMLTRAAEKITDIINDPKLSGGQKFEALAKMAGDAFSAAIPKVADAAAKAAPVVLRAFLDGFRNSSLWGKLIIGGFLLAKMGGLGPFRAVGTKAGGAMGSGMANGAARTAGAQLPGKFAGLRSRMAGIGKNVLGFALLAGITDAASATDLKGFGDRVQRGLSTATLGFIPQPKTISEKLRQSVKLALTGGSVRQEGWSQFWNQLGDGLDASGQRTIAKLRTIRERAIATFGPGIKLRADLDVTKAGHATKLLETNMNRLRNHLAGDTASMARITAQNMRLIAQTMGLHSKSGRAAITQNMRASLRAVKDAMSAGDISAKTGMAAIRKAFVVGSRGSKQSAQTNFGLAKAAITSAVRSGEITAKQGLKEIARLFRAYLGQFGIKGKAADTYLKHPHGGSTEGSQGVADAFRARGGVVGFGTPGGRGRDTIPATIGRARVMVGSGEVAAVLNRHQQRDLNARTADVGGLSGFFNRNKRPHYMAGGGLIARQVVGGPDSAIRRLDQEGLDRNRRAANAKLAAAAGQAGGGETSTTGLVPRVRKALAFARAHGWGGSVTSGFRSEAEQVRIWNSGIRPAAKPRSLGGPGSNHSLGQAVDISDIPGFQRAMNMMPPNQRLYARVPNDPIHFSVTGNALGGFVRMAGGGLVGRFNSTSYGPPWNAMNGTGTTATGINLKGAPKRHIMAVDPNVLKLGRKYWAKPNPFGYGGPFLAGDTGGAIKGNRVDFYDWRGRSAQMGWGRKATSIYSRSPDGGSKGPGKKLTPKQRKKAAKQLKKKLRRIRGTGLSKKTEAHLKKLTQNAAIYGEYADRAGTLTGPDGGTAGAVNGFGEASWLQKQLDTLFSLRNALIRAEAAVVVKREGASKELEKAYEWLRAHPLSGTKKGKDPAAGWKGVSPATGSMNAWNKQPIKKRKERMGKFIRRGGRLPSDRRFLADGRVATDRSGAGRKRQVENYKKKVIPALKKSRSGLNTRRGELLSSLETVQGLGAPSKVLKSLPAMGVLGGEIFSAQTRLRDLGAKVASTDTAPAVDTTRADLLAGLLRESNLRTAVSQRQYEVFRNMPPYGGQFAQGGVVPGAVGAPRMILAHGGETVTPPGGAEVHLHFAPGTEWLRDFVDVRVEQGTRKQARAGGRVLPGRGGGG